MSKPIDRLKHHVTGAIERGEKQAIEAVVKPKHTPGPWFVQAEEAQTNGIESLGVVSDNGEIIAEIYIADIHGEPNLGRANARLIAASPELLEHVNVLIEVLANKVDQDPHFYRDKLVADLKAIRDKAAGGAE